MTSTSGLMYSQNARGAAKAIMLRRQSRNISKTVRIISSQLPLTRKAKINGDILSMKSASGSGWKVELTSHAEKSLRKLGSVDRHRVYKFLATLENTDNPKQTGKLLVGLLAGVWRYRVGDIRVLCRLEADRLIILVLEIANRREVYR
jgi:mRNA interferase RelE/StbE